MITDAENWDQLQELFHLAESTPPDDRERVLAEHCADESLCRRVLEILRGAEPDGQAPEILTSTFNGDAAGNRVGPYTIVRHLGSGGLGAVYLVERMTGGVIQRAALKMLAPHAVAPSFVERFHREQHILASLDHPNITRMLDAGMSAEQPFLVMEYVDGLHLDAYCDAHSLSIQERLQLFLHVCEAVAYAHRNLIVHLDLKPSNILVTEDGTVKLLDFGTSKLLRFDSQLTTTVLATPAYASPEQLRNEAVTTACDVYALGAILFELLAGKRPGEKASVAAMIERAMREQEVEPLPDAVTIAAAEKRGLPEHRLRQLLRGDLATIVAKCLRPRPQDRYASVDFLAGDVRLFMEGRPILARPQTTFYKLGKFARRNRSAVIAALVFAIALIASLSYAEWRQAQALREGRRAERMQTFMYRLFKLANSSFTGKPAATVPEFLELGVKVLPEYIKDPADVREAQLSLAESMFENGDLKNAQAAFMQTIASAQAAGDIQSEAEAEAFAGEIAYQFAQLDQGAKLTARSLELSRRSSVSSTVRVWSEIYYASNREKLGTLSDENLHLLQAAVRESRDKHLPERETAYAIYELSEDFEVRGRLDEAEQLLREDIAIYNNEPYALCDQSQMYEDLAYISVSRNDLRGSLPLYQKAYEGLKACSGPDKKNTLMVQALMAGAMNKMGQSQAAIPILESSLPAWKKVAGSSPDLFAPMYYLASAYVATGRYADGEAMAQQLLTVLQATVAAKDRRTGATQMVYARALAGQHRYQEALPHAEIACQLTANGITPYRKQLEAEAKALLAEIQSKLHS
jgi:serine/threonine-protein kinase